MALPRIAIVGGGVGAVTAAVQLSRPGWEQHFDSITVYQQGWRLGGKGACGRGPDNRIEEHGLHIWFGFYENAFRIMDRCHRELDALAAAPGGPARWGLPFASVEETFSPCHDIALTDHDGCAWKLWVADFFDFDDDRPWLEPDPRPPGERPDDWSVAFYLSRCLRLAADLAWSLVRSDPGLELAAHQGGPAREEVRTLDHAIRAVRGALGGDIREVLDAVATLIDRAAAETIRHPLVLEGLGVALRALDLALDFMRGRYDDLARSSDAVRRAYYVVDLMVAIGRGLIDDGVIEHESFAVIDDRDLREWLLSHGAARESVDCALIRAVVYDLAFAFDGGDPNRPSCGAGTALRGMLRAFFTYRGSLMWKMASGMGDVIFGPLYELLIKRGVDVRFFHRVEAIRAANGAVQEIEVDVQADVPAGTGPADFLVPTTSDPADPRLGWPSAPTVLGSAAFPPEAYESWYLGRDAARVRTEVLGRGAPDGFDLVVLGTPISCVPSIAPDLLAQSQRWRDAVDHVRTVPTQALQLWLDRPASDLADVEPGTISSGFVEPFDTWADMVQVVPEEQVAGSMTVAYFCNAAPDVDPPARGQAGEWLDEQRALVRHRALRFLRRDVKGLWPKAVDPLTGEFDWDRLVAPAGQSGESRLDAQYLRANVEPSERYVLSVPGSSRYRIPPDDTGFSNLYVVGDWTACTIDAGCVEAAAISGMVAANAIHAGHGDPAEVETIVGLDHA